MTCRQDMTLRVEDEMRAFARKVYGGSTTLPWWVEPAMRQHAEYAAADYCDARGLAGLGNPDETTLPSVGAAEAFLTGQSGGTVRVLESVAVRAGFIALGLLAVGQRQGVVKGALAGATAIEAFVLWTVRRQLQDAGRLARSNGGG